MSPTFDKTKFRQMAGAFAGALAALALLAGAGNPLALAQAKTTAHFIAAKPSSAPTTVAATPAGPKLPGAGPLYETATAPSTGYYVGTAPVNGSARQKTLGFTTSSTSASYVPTLGLQYGISYSLGTVSCTETITSYSSLPYVQTCTVPVTFAPLYAGGHRDAMYILDTDGVTRIGGAFLYGIGEAPQLMIQPGATTNVQIPGRPSMFGSTTDEAGTYYVYAGSGFYTVKKNGTIAQVASSVGRGYTLSIDGAGNLFDPGSGGFSGYEFQTSSGFAYTANLCYSTEGLYSQNPQTVVYTYCYTNASAVAAGNLGTYYEADGGGEATNGSGGNPSPAGLLVQPYGYLSSTNAGITTTTTNPADQVSSPPPPPELPDGSAQPAGGDLPLAYPLNGGNIGPSAMVVDAYENLFMLGNNGMAVWCGWGTTGLASSTDTSYSAIGVSSAITGSTAGCGGWGTSMVQLNSFSGNGSTLAVDAADTVYATTESIQMYSVTNNYASAMTSIGVPGFAGNMAVAPDGTIYVQSGINNNIQIIDRSTGSIDFGLNNGQVSNPYVMTLYNGGNQPLTISSIAASGAGYSVQPYTSAPCSTSGSTVVAVGTLCLFQVTFTAAHNGTSLGDVTITSNSLNNASTTQTITLSAAPSGIYVTATPSTTLAFGSQSASTTMGLVVTNNSVGSNSVGYGSSVSINALTSSNPSVFAVTQGNCPASQPSGTSCGLNVTYNPTAGQIPSGKITWTETISGTNISQNFSIDVTGTGISPPVPLTVTAQSVSRNFAVTNPSFSATITNSSGGAVPTITGAPAFATTAMLNSPAGTYPITPSVGTLSTPSGYSFTFVPGTLTVLGGVTPTITFHIATNNGSLPLALGNLTLTAVSTAGALGQPIVYTATGPATVSGSTLTLSGTGPVTVTATQAGNATFNLATATQSFTVTP